MVTLEKRGYSIPWWTMDVLPNLETSHPKCLSQTAGFTLSVPWGCWWPEGLRPDQGMVSWNGGTPLAGWIMNFMIENPPTDWMTTEGTPSLGNLRCTFISSLKHPGNSTAQTDTSGGYLSTRRCFFFVCRCCFGCCSTLHQTYSKVGVYSRL